MTLDLETMSYILILFSLAMYILQDGTELGLGVMYPACEDRETLIQILPEKRWVTGCWLVIACVGWVLVFPVVFETVFASFLIPTGILIFAQMIRYWCQSKLRRQAESSWGWVFFSSSILIAFCHGLMLGEAIHGFEYQDENIITRWFSWVSPLSGVCALATVVAYSQLGLSWYIKKTDSSHHGWVYERSGFFTVSLLVLIMIVSMWLPFTNVHITLRWFSWPQILFLSPIPLLTAWIGFLLWLSHMEQRHSSPYYLTIALISLCFLGFSISTWPYVIPWKYTIWEAASPAQLQIVGVIFLIFSIPTLFIYQKRVNGPSTQELKPSL